MRRKRFYGERYPLRHKKNKSKPDLALIFSSVEAKRCCGIYDKPGQGSALIVTRSTWRTESRAIICNSGNANGCIPNGIEVATEMCRLAAEN